jgi:very-short-patch-repair endonuclease
MDRADLVGRAVSGWIDQLTDLSGRNNLLYYRDLRHGTLDLASASDSARDRLLKGGKVRCSQLFPGPLQADAVSRLKGIHRKMKELAEERGIHTGYVAAGMASWHEDRKSPAAPIILRELSITPTTPARDDFDLTLDEESVINPVLLYKLRADFRIDISAEQLGELAGGTAFDIRPVHDRLRDIAMSIPGFRIENRLVAGTFTYAKLPMVQDLQESSDLLVATDMIAALAGDPRAEQAIRMQDVGQEAVADGQRPPANEYLVLDADSSQNAAINAVLRGRNLIIQGPPGTGKSQTIANMIASLVAEGKHVLFVAEKRAAIDAVAQRLERLGLSGLVLDIHDGVQNKRRMAQELDAAFRAVRQVAAPDVSDLHRRLSDRVRRADDHAAVMRESRSPWDISLFDAQARLMRIPSQQRSPLRMRNEVLRRLAGELVDQIRDDLREYASLLGRVDAVWAGADIRTREQAQLANDTAQRLESALRAERDRLRALCAALGRTEPVMFAEWVSMYLALGRISETCQLLGVGIYATDITAMATATARRAERRRRVNAELSGVKLGWSARRALRKEAESYWQGRSRTRQQLYAALVAAEEQSAEWRRSGYPGDPAVLPGWPTAASGFRELLNCVETLDGMLPGAPLGRMSYENLLSVTSRLAADGRSPQHLARLAELSARLTDTGLRQLTDQIAATRTTPDNATIAFDSAWYASIIDHVRLTDRRCDTLSGTDLSRIVAELRRYDTEHLKRNTERVLRVAAERARHAQDTYPDQASLVRREAGKARKHLPLRDLLVRAPDVLLALKPCWAISPIVVSQVLPARRLFDVVIFDEASQVKQADAVPSIIRAAQVVVAGDKKQLPPTDFFSSAADDDQDAEDDTGGLRTADGETIVARTGSAFESILDTLGTLLPDAPLTWHYRSRDERLITFSNQHFYEPKMTTFPGIGSDECLVHIVAEQATGIAGQEQSVAAEVERVVELILDHARMRPDESLGVITLGLPHMRRIEAKLEAALRSRGDVTEFFAEKDVDKSFFVKNLERVQGDERDAIILSTGFGKTADNRMLYNWGPLLREGGERRLNVAVTRARIRLTLVTSFRAEEADPSRVTREGGKLLCDYLRYADSGGGNPGMSRLEDLPLNPFELDVLERLRGAEIPVIPQYGVGGMRIDFAAQHPQFPGRMVLAIEADGATYHSSRSARDRDRLRQEHLERLGWQFHRIWSTDWFNDPEGEIAKVRAAYDQAIIRAERTDERQPPTRPHTPSRHQQETPPLRRKARPPLEQGLTTDKYEPRDLCRLAEWIESDGILRTEEEVLAEMMLELGRQRKTEKADTALRTAIRTARSRR